MHYSRPATEDSSGVTTPNDSFTVEYSSAIDDDDVLVAAADALLAALLWSCDRLRFHFAGSIVPQRRFTWHIATHIRQFRPRTAHSPLHMSNTDSPVSIRHRVAYGRKRSNPIMYGAHYVNIRRA